MTEDDRFILERASCLGGSDAPHLLQLDPFGCQRRLMYEKIGVPADVPFLGNRHTKRGKRLEEIAAEEFEELTGRALRRYPFQRDRNHPFLGCHIDRCMKTVKSGITIRPRSGDAPHGQPLIVKGPGSLSIKVPSHYPFRKLKAGGPDLAKVVQLQWELGITGWSWGAICCFHADGWEPVYWDYYRDGELIGEMKEEGCRLWSQVERARSGLDYEMPDRLPPEDRRCQTCPWRKTCQGQDTNLEVDRAEDIPPELVTEAMPYLGPMIQEYLEAKEIESEATAFCKGLKRSIDEAVGKDKLRVVDAGVGRVVVAQRERKGYTVKEAKYVEIRVLGPKKGKKDV